MWFVICAREVRRVHNRTVDLLYDPYNYGLELYFLKDQSIDIVDLRS